MYIHDYGGMIEAHVEARSQLVGVDALHRVLGVELRWSGLVASALPLDLLTGPEMDLLNNEVLISLK